MPKAASVLAVVVTVLGSSACGGSSPTTTPLTTLPPPTPAPSPVDPVTVSCPLGKGDVNARCGASAVRLLTPVQAAAPPNSPMIAVPWVPR